jgi:hypothetical protein
MRALVVTSILALMISHSPALFSGAKALFFEDHDPHLRHAIALRCDDPSQSDRDSCEQELRSEFASGAREPEAIVRRHCTRFANRWATEAEPASSVCHELYGGWIEG